jgi:hypothetical protein
MAITTYRYRRDQPFTDAQLVKMAGSGAANVAAAGGPIYDVQIDSTKLADLDEQLLLAGYTRIASAPSGTPATIIREGGGTLLTLGAVSDGQNLQRSGTTIIGASAGTSYDVRDQIIFDHFIGGTVASSSLGSYSWQVAATGSGNNQQETGESGYPGIIRLTNGTAAAARSAIHLGDTTLRNILAGGTNAINFECLVSPRVSVASADVLRIQMGLGSGWALANPNPLTDGIYFRLEPSLSSHWFGVVANASTRTTVDLGVVATVGTWYRLGFVMTPSGTPQVQFKLNGSNVGSAVTTNIPSTLLGPGFRTDGNGGTASDIFIDYVSMTQVTNKET